MEHQYHKEYIRELAHKWRTGTLTSEELRYLETWDKSHADEILTLKEGSDPNQIKNRILSTVLGDYLAEQPPAVTLTKLWSRISVAIAFAVAIFGAGLFYFSKGGQQDGTVQVTLEHDVVPGISGATLTLASGKKIRLSDAVSGQLAEESGVLISKHSNGQLVYELNGGDVDPNKINTLSTAKGETYKLRLPDGSLVYLNAASSLTYAAALGKHGKRVVSLKGEGYFEISKDKAHPFVVRTDKQEVEVLGTHFNVNAYADEPVVSTMLLEGSVKLVSGNGGRVLKPGELAENGRNGIKVSVANAEAITDWKNDEFFLDKLDFRMAMRKLARWYNIEVIYSGSVPANLEAGGWIPRNNKLSDVLRAIEATGQVHFKIDGRKLYVTK